MSLNLSGFHPANLTERHKSEEVNINTYGSDFDTVLAVWEGMNLATLVELNSNDDASHSLQSELSFQAQFGATYWIAVYGYSISDKGDITLNLSTLNSNNSRVDLLTYTDIGNGIEITGFPEVETGHLTIPDTIDSKPVISIGHLAFNSSRLTSIKLPSNLQIIGFWSFHGSELNEIAISDTVTTIDENAFGGCSNLTDVHIPDGVNMIGRAAFGNCRSLTSINVAAENPSYTSVDGVLFNKSQSILLASPAGKSGVYTIPNSTTTIGDDAFDGSSLISSINIPTTVTTIGEGAFRGCTSITQFTIPRHVSSIGRAAFFNCWSLTGINVDPANSHYASVAGVLFDASKQIIIRFPSARGGSYVIPNGITTIGDYSFSGSELGTLIIPDGVTTIEFGGLEGTRFRELTLPTSIQTIGASAFEGSRIESLSFPPNVTSIGTTAFVFCLQLRSVFFSSPAISIGNSAFLFCDQLEVAHFSGDAPIFFGTEVFDGTAPDFSIYYQSTSTGFTSPTWNGYPATMVNVETHPAGSWLLKHGLAFDSDLDQDLNQDGKTLLQEFFHNVPPAGKSQDPIRSSVVEAGGRQFLDLIYRRRKDYQGIIPTVQSADALGPNSWKPFTNFTEIVTQIDKETDEVCVRRDMTGLTRGFLRLGLARSNP